MSKESKESSKQEKEDVLSKAYEDSLIEGIVALSPLVGVSAEELKSSVKKTIKHAITQPSKMANNSKQFVGKVADIIKGTDKYEGRKNDRRFDDPSWEENALYHKLKQAYFAWDESLGELVDELELDTLDRLRARFVKDVITTSMAPTNFLLSNPKALRRVVESRGSSLVTGLRNYVDDLKNNNGMPSQVDKSQFKVGGNLAISEGAVVFRNELLELIQYTPLTAKVYRRPLLVIPPQINKFYIYDLTEEKSFFHFCLQQGFQVFAVSWRNPTKEQRHWGMDQYVLAVAEAIDAIQKITKSKKLNVVGACAGGVTASILSSYLKQTGSDLVGSLSLSVCMLNMESEEMELGVYSSPETIRAARAKSQEKGVLEGAELAKVFSWMRPNDLVWNYHVNNYLMGEAPPAFDLLYWNSDSTNLPAQLHADFLDMFEHNTLYKGAMTVQGVEIDLAALDCDKYITAGLSDHITPWKTCYKTTQFIGGDVTFVLSSSGHIQSLVNPPANKKSKYFVNKDLPESADNWLEGAEQCSGSWWTHWADWLSGRSGGQKIAPKSLGNPAFKPQEAAPGTYVFG